MGGDITKQQAWWQEQEAERLHFNPHTGNGVRLLISRLISREILPPARPSPKSLQTAPQPRSQVFKGAYGGHFSLKPPHTRG